MFNLIGLAIQVGRLEKRVEELEKQQNSGKSVPVTVNMGEAPAEDKAGKLLQDGIDNILGYQWPPRKEARE